MDSLLVAGVESMVGANFAVQLSEHFSISTCGWRTGRSIAGCQVLDSELTPTECLTVTKAQRLILCGSGAHSGWYDSFRPKAEDVLIAESWLRAAKKADIAVTLISSDAVFTGPWMFHAENSSSLCASPEAKILRQIEQLAGEILPEALVLRTHAFGWSDPWLEDVISALTAGRESRMDCVRHASPILVNDLIDVTLRCWDAGLAGIYHVAGAERCNPVSFIQKLAAEFGYKIPRCKPSQSLTNCTNGYGCSETSLQTRKVRRALHIAVPFLKDGLNRLRRLSLNGFRDLLHNESDRQPPARAA